ncbi:lysylphosphatidylglycerol synthase transmembrane domain-containing protein [Ornithinimicrobium cavernae]|uniref:lysylphosphatidylglycerol synthase transmembrane domain-containing protein n=1 Tax=Ornithinimicrobium cavernae TaxID=2666047 RepID=UPI000D69AF3D|nr:lysylphosphatidylglycerol synthase transmembrane domain-containing protein [Ornithinimicrobium cavernae]
MTIHATEDYEPTRKFGWREVLQSVVGLTIATLLLIFVLPRVADSSWPDILRQMALVGGWVAVLMVVLKLIGLYSYTFTLTGSLPGLSHRRALLVNASGSMISNIMPMGGAVAVAITYVMCRSWGFMRRNISTSLVVTGVWNIMARLALPVIAILVVIIGPMDTPAPVILGSVIAVVALLMVLAFFLAVIYSDKASHLVGHSLGWVAKPFSKRLRAGANLDSLIQDQRGRWGNVASSNGWKMSLGLAGMLGIFFVLYLVACHTVGVELPIAHIFAAYAIRQLLTVVAITPGGLGITEAGTAAVLIAFGADPTAAAAAALLYAVVTHLLDVPLGALAMLIWWLSPNRPTTYQLDSQGELAPTPRGAALPGGERAEAVGDPAPSTAPDEARNGQD